MAVNERTDRCRYCGHPAKCTGPAMTEDRFHNSGCPVGDITLSENSAMVEWKNGYRYGFEDNYIEPHRYRYHSKTFILGYCRGKNAIDELVELAVERNYSIDE